ncbi:peptidyl-prolyl cis-trans isomerase CYP28, chloroplastic [Silene latifolia]|uniref:peptidyl-prolyl cis-trans isomerase CYP28, chloroplastic n=1 Tax=Silene latifolia TaxID=37657 RepID=UPI003D7761C6
MLSFHPAKLVVPHGLAYHHHHHHHHQYVSKPILCSASSSSHHHDHDHNSSSRRSLLLLLPTALSLPLPPYTSASDNNNNTTTPLDTTITDRVFLDLSICPTYFRAQAQSQDVPLCSDSEPLGRVVLGLYGKLVPTTVSIFKAMCIGSSSYKNTFIHKVLPGQFLVGGRQGRREKGEVVPPLGLPQNKETVDSRAFMLDHSRPGVVSLCLSENDDDDDIKLDPDYHNVEFLITTGPGPCPQLDGRNIVFGVVLEGMDVVRQIASIPTYKPGERIKLFNDLAEFLGDGRAENARNLWDRPLKSIYVSDCGQLQVAKPSLTPSLP